MNIIKNILQFIGVSLAMFFLCIVMAILSPFIVAYVMLFKKDIQKTKDGVTTLADEIEKIINPDASDSWYKEHKKLYGGEDVDS